MPPASDRQLDHPDLFGRDAVRLEAPSVKYQRVALLPLIQFLLGTIPLGVAFVVTMPSVSRRLDNHRASPRPDCVDDACHHVRCCDDIVAVNRDMSDAVAGSPISEGGSVLVCSGGELGVAVVLAKEDDR